MSKQWNEQQIDAITTRHTNILVSASAGSGKTGVLVQRLVDLVTIDHIEIDQILAMTFSEDAASEMKKRLSKEITQLANDEKDEDNKQYLLSQLSKLSNAHISTIHSFCYSIIKNYYYLLGLSSKRISTLCDDSQQKIYQNQALEKVLDMKIKEKNSSFVLLCSSLCTRPENLQPLKDAILKIATMADSQSDPEGWLMMAKNNSLASIKETKKVQYYFMDYFKSLYRTYQQAFETMKQQFDEHYPNEEKKYATFNKKYECMKQIADFNDFDELAEKMIFCAKLPLPSSPDASNLLFKDARKQITDIEDEILSIPVSDVMEKMMVEAQPMILELLECVQLYFRHYEQIKDEKEVIDFSDMEHFAIKLLKNFNEVSDHYRSLFKEIMVDEFQDSNDVQDELVHLICQKDNVFRVGDVKQSIYGFRHALPGIMQSYKEKEDAYNKVIRFNKNYRSDATIIEFNNVLYQILMNIEGFDSLPFNDEDLSETGLSSQQNDNQPIIFHALDPQLKSYETEKINKDIYKAEYIAHEILKQSEHHKFNEFAVLVRSNAKMEVLKSVFEKYNIPYYMNQKSGFYESRSIQILVSILYALSDPNNDFYFAAVLTSIFFKLDSIALGTISHNKRNQSYYQYLKEKMPQLLDEFERIRISALSISEMIQECFKWNQFYDTCSLQDQTNCDYFYELALDYEDNISCECINFLTYIDSLKEQETAQTSTIGKNDNVVRFMSIHNSKGLEFPIVYLWATSSMKKMELNDMVLCDNELGIGFNIMQFPYRNIFKSYQRIAIEHKKNRDELEEELRILYVATTRAKKQLHIVDFLDANLDIDHGINYSKMNARKGTTSWILQAIHHLHKDDLFTIHYVDQLWETSPLKRKTEQAFALPIYHDNEVIELVSPSETENFDFEVRALNFNEKNAANRGTNYHAYLEHLPNTQWDESMIRDTSISYHLDIDDQLISDLLNLNQNPLFTSLRNTKIYHEYPFLVQDGTIIYHGYMDYLSIGETITLIDFKSDDVNHEQKLIDRYSSQILSYKRACELLFPDKTITAYIYSFALSKMIQI